MPMTENTPGPSDDPNQWSDLDIMQKKAAAKMREMAGNKFDKDIVEIFLQLLQDRETT